MPRKNKKSSAKSFGVRPRWTREEISVLRRMYRTNSNAEIAGILGRKVSSVVFKAHRMGLSKGARRLKEMGQENISKRWAPRKNKALKKASASRGKK
jgi:hypothetical protein